MARATLVVGILAVLLALSGVVRGWELFDWAYSEENNYGPLSNEDRELPNSIIQQRLVSVDFSQLQALHAPGEQENLVFNLFKNVTLVGIVTWTKSEGEMTQKKGFIEGVEGSMFHLTQVGKAVHGTLHTPTANYKIQSSSFAGLHIVQQLDYSVFPEEEHVVPEQTETYAFTEEQFVSADDGTTYDVLVVYTPGVVTAMGGNEQSVLALINTAIAETNTIYANSRVDLRVRLAHAARASGDGSLSQLAGQGDGVLDEVHALRDQYCADFVVQIRQMGGSCGVGYLWTNPSSSFASSAFCQVDYTCATGYYSFAHELGHNMGCHHDTGSGGGSGAMTPYSYGWVISSGKYRSVMAYSNNGETRVAHFSNPNVLYSGLPTGSADKADNARSINNVKATFAKWRDSAKCGTNPTPSPSASASVSRLVSPSPSASRLVSPSPSASRLVSPSPSASRTTQPSLSPSRSPSVNVLEAPVWISATRDLTSQSVKFVFSMDPRATYHFIYVYTASNGSYFPVTTSDCVNNVCTYTVAQPAYGAYAISGISAQYSPWSSYIAVA